MNDVPGREETEDLPPLEGRAAADDRQALLGRIGEGLFPERTDPRAIGPDVGFREDEDGVVPLLRVVAHRVDEGLPLLRGIGKGKGSEENLDRPQERIGNGLDRADDPRPLGKSQKKRHEEGVGRRRVVGVNKDPGLPEAGPLPLLLADNFRPVDDLHEKPGEGNADDVVDAVAQKPVNQVLVVELELFR